MLSLSLAAPISPAGASPDEVQWSRVNLPTEGETGNWVLASGSNVQHLAMAVDGTLYSYANPAGTNDTLFKSVDTGDSWSPTGMVKDIIVALATAPDTASIIYYATASNVYQSTDSGNSFISLPPPPSGAGSNNITITDLAVARWGGNSIIAIGTRDTDAAQYGGVYLLDKSMPSTAWANTNIGNYDVLAIAFSPNFAADRQLVAAVTDETDTLVTSRISDDGWGRVSGNATIKGLAPRDAAIAFPNDYDATTEAYALFVAIDTGSDQGGVYLVRGKRAPANSMATDLAIGSADNLSGLDVTGLAVSGNTTAARLLAGTANRAQVYISTDSGSNWTKSTKAPTGESKTYLLMAPDFTSSGRAYAATSGAESAFAYTADSGTTWNQVSLIDSKISEIRDLAVSPDYSQDNTLYLLTFDGEQIEHSLWRSLNSGAKWERVFTSTLASADRLKLIELSPQYGRDSQVVFLAGSSGSNSVIWKSTDKGQAFRPRGASFPVDIWTVVNDNTLFLGSYDGNNGLLYRTINSGLAYSAGATVGNQPLTSMAISANYEQDKTLLIGNTNGRVYWSEDDGTSFKRLGQQLPLSSTVMGEVTVVFDPNFDSNKVVYAASAAAVTTGSKERLYRFIIGRNDTWESLDSTLPVGSMLSQLAVSANEALYAINSQKVAAVKKEGGMARSLNPTYPLGPTFEMVIRGLDDGATLNGLWLRGNQIWSIDTTNTRLMTYSDTLALAVTLISPLNEAADIGTGNISLKWESLQGATKYHWQLDDDTDFSSISEQFEGDTEKSSARPPALEVATTYYWRVRATTPVLSSWSAKRSFTTSPGTAVITPELFSPKVGATGVPIKPVFQWSAITEADRYELLVSTKASFTNPIIVRIGGYALTATAWQSDIKLEYNTAYYWKVRASGSSSYSAWSTVSVFTTESLPSPASELSVPEPSVPELSVPELSVPEPASPSPSPSPQLSSSTPLPSPSPQLSPPPPLPPPAQPTLPDWLIYLGGALLLTAVLVLITLLVLVVRIRRA